MRVGRSRSPTARSATARTASIAASVSRAARSTRRPRPTSRTYLMRSSTAWRSARGHTPRVITRHNSIVYIARAWSTPTGRRDIVSGYSIETPRLLLNSGLGNDLSGPLCDGPGWRRRSRAVSRSSCSSTRDRRPISCEQFYETDAAAGSRAAFRSRTVGGSDRLGEPRLADGIGAWPCAGTCATTTTGRRSASSASCAAAENRVTLADAIRRHGVPSRVGLHAVREGPRPTLRSRPNARANLGGRGHPGRADDQPLGISSAAFASAPRRRTASSTPTSACWGRRTSSSATAASTPNRCRNAALTIMALASRLAGRLDRARRVDEREVGEGLREVPEELAGPRVDLLREQADVVGQRHGSSISPSLVDAPGARERAATQNEQARNAPSCSAIPL